MFIGSRPQDNELNKTKQTKRCMKELFTAMRNQCRDNPTEWQVQCRTILLSGKMLLSFTFIGLFFWITLCNLTLRHSIWRVSLHRFRRRCLRKLW